MDTKMDGQAKAYPQINSLKYLGELCNKHRYLVASTGLILGSLFWLTSYVLTYTSSAILKFHSNEVRGATTVMPSTLGMMEKNEGPRDKSFTYLSSTPFYIELAKKMLAYSEGEQLLPAFRKQNDILSVLKGLFFESISYEIPVSRELKLSQHLQKILWFKKDNNNSIVLYTRAENPKQAVKLANIFRPMIREIVLANESQDLNLKVTHIKEQLEKSQANLEQIEAEFAKHNKDRSENAVILGNLPMATFELERDLRTATIEAQRYDALVRKLEGEIDENSVYVGSDGSYRYVNEISLERLTELKQQRDLASAKLSSLKKSYEKIKVDNQKYPSDEQTKLNLKWGLELEQLINKDLKIKLREHEGLLSVMESSISVPGEAMPVPVSFKLARSMRFILGLLLGSFTALLGLYYYYDFFKVIKGIGDIYSFGNLDVVTSIPSIGGYRSRRLDVWKDLPSNHYASEGFRQVMEKAEGAKIMAVLSASRGEGKSFIIANLAENLSKFGKKVLVIDTDWRSQDLSKVLKNKEQIQLIHASEFKHGKDTFLDRSQLIKTIKGHSQNYDVVLIDTQDINSSSDGLVAASVCNYILIVCAHLETYHYQFHDLLKKLEAADVSNYGIALNKVRGGNEMLRFKGQVRILDSIDTNTIYIKKSG